MKIDICRQISACWMMLIRADTLVFDHHNQTTIFLGVRIFLSVAEVAAFTTERKKQGLRGGPVIQPCESPEIFFFPCLEKVAPREGFFVAITMQEDEKAWKLLPTELQYEAQRFDKWLDYQLLEGLKLERLNS